ncbi:hypothetical protein BJ508DRAFT_365765 [Ascobolus immersus RN42]|uniref:Uncharacterized protein n=1 Tax=Ascobolus immersus RN42 TaxID=1160509 RepID=A0A3N4HN91_ASCIM|nr:hypothetical protein BJ508DRAFT_365765 [Ascobolus immersus RN42]
MATPNRPASRWIPRLLSRLPWTQHTDTRAVSPNDPQICACPCRCGARLSLPRLSEKIFLSTARAETLPEGYEFLHELTVRDVQFRPLMVAYKYNRLLFDSVKEKIEESERDDMRRKLPARAVWELLDEYRRFIEWAEWHEADTGGLERFGSKLYRCFRQPILVAFAGLSEALNDILVTGFGQERRIGVFRDTALAIVDNFDWEDDDRDHEYRQMQTKEEILELVRKFWGLSCETSVVGMSGDDMAQIWVDQDDFVHLPATEDSLWSKKSLEEEIGCKPIEVHGAERNGNQSGLGPKDNDGLEVVSEQHVPSSAVEDVDWEQNWEDKWYAVLNHVGRLQNSTESSLSGSGYY